MINIGSYLLQMSCWLAAFWLVYVFLLKKETYFTLNRWFLIAGLMVSVIVPLVPVTYKVYRTVQPLEVFVVENTNIDLAEPVNTINYWLLAYLIGTVFFIGRLLYQHLQLYFIRKRSTSVSVGSAKVYRMKKETAPFSFFNHIYVSSNMSNELELNTIVAHEKVHIVERHWADLLLLEVVRTIQWFNPLIQLYRKAMMQNHEYLADSGTLEFGVSARTYRAVLANQMLGVPVVSFANSFTFRNSTNRILMMKKDKSTPIKRLKFLLILPLMTIIVMGFAKPNYVTENSTNSLSTGETMKIKGKVFDENDKPMNSAAVIISGTTVGTITNDNGDFVLANVKPTDEVRASYVGYDAVILPAENEMTFRLKKAESQTIKINGKVTDTNGEPMPGASIIISKTNIGTLSDNNGDFILDGVKPSDNIVVSFVGYETVVSPVKKNMTIEMDREVVQIEVKKSEGVPPPPPPPPPAHGVEFRSKNGKTPLIVIDGKISDVDLTTIDPETIERIDVLKDESATVSYGEKGKDGVILITTKEKATSTSQTPPPDQPVAIRSIDGKTPLIVVDGKISDVDINSIDPESIEKIEVIKNEAATAVYGKKGKDGIILVTTKKQTKRISPEGETFVVVEDMPQYPGGKEALDQYIRDAASKVGLTGKAYVTFTINAKGEVQNARIARSTSDQLKKSALEIVNSMPKWKPGMQRGKPVKVSYSIAIEF